MLHFVFIVCLIGICDLLHVVKDVSLLQQKVNTLPWEVCEAELNLIRLMDELGTPERNRRVRSAKR